MESDDTTADITAVVDVAKIIGSIGGSSKNSQSFVQ